MIIIVSGAGLAYWLMDGLNARDPGLILLATLAALAQILKVEGSTERSSYNISWLAYGLAFLLLGGPAAFFVILVAHVVEWAWHRYAWYIQCYNIASYAMAVTAASLAYGWINASGEPFGLAGAGGLLAALVAFTLVNHLLIGLVIWLARGQNFAQSGVFGFFTLTMDFTLISLGAATGLVWLINPFASILNVIPLYLLHNTLKVPALQRQTEIDPKTRLFNARYFAEALERELARAERFDRPMTVVLADLDLLRNINNTYGHLAGDVVLIGVADILKDAFRNYDVVARFGGEEYAVLMPETTPEQALPRIEEVRKKIESVEFAVTTSVTPIQATISFGLAGREKPGQTSYEIVHNADVALYRAKLGGRNCSCVYNGETVEGLFAGLNTNGVVKEGTGLKSRLENRPAPFQPNPLRKGNAPSRPNAETRSQPTWLLHAYLVGVLLAALGLFGLILHPVPAVDWAGLATFALVVLLFEGLAIELHVEDHSLSTSAAPLLAGVLLFGPMGALVLSIGLAGIAALKNRHRLNHLILNASLYLLGSSLSVGLLSRTHVPLSEHPDVVQIALALVSAEMLYLISTGLTAGYLSLTTSERLRALWRRRFYPLWPYYFGLGVAAYALIFSYQQLGVLGVLAVLVPLMVLRFGQAQIINESRISVQRLRLQTRTLENRTIELSDLNDELMLALANVIDIRDPHVLGHSQQVAHFAVWIARELSLPARQVDLIRRAALLHDVGKLGIPESLLQKPGALTTRERELLSKHSSRVAELIKEHQPLQSLYPVIRYHQERFDGSGYPEGLKGNQIPLEARIISLADALDAMACERPYRQALTWEEIRAELQANAGSQFDPVLVETVLKILDQQGEAFIANAERTAPVPGRELEAETASSHQASLHPAR